MEQLPQTPQPDRPDDPSTRQPDGQHPFEELELKSARTLTTVATVAGPVSLIIGGVALSTVALVCAIIAFTKVRRLLSQGDFPQRPYALTLRQTALIALGVSAVALVLNGITVAMMMPVLLEAMQTGDYSAILGDAAANLQNTPKPSNGGSAWG